MSDGMPCWNCDETCGFIMMSNCEKLIIWIKLDRDNETKNEETIKEEASKEISSTNS